MSKVAPFPSAVADTGAVLVSTADTGAADTPGFGVAELGKVLGTDQVRSSAPYIQRWRDVVVVVKLGGSAMTDATLAETFAADVVLLATLGVRIVVVHGGGPQIGELMDRLGKQPEFRNGLRVTDAETLEIAQMVLAGKLNINIVRRINAHGSRAVGVSGTDARLITAAQKDPELGFVGEVVSVDPTLLTSLMSAGMIPVVSTIGSDTAGQGYNINADTAAGAIAAALGAEKLLYMTNVDGLYADIDDPNSLVSRTDIATLSISLANGELESGMIPKIGACVDAIAAGVGSAHLLNGQVRHAVLRELYTDAGVGTMITNESV